MRISTMRDVLELTAIDHVYYRSYDPLVRCVGREYTPHRAAQIAMLVAGGRLKWTPDVAEAMYWSFNSKIDQIWNRDNAGPMFDIDEGEWDRPARADVVDAGSAPEFVKAIEANVKEKGNIYGTQEDKSPVGQADVLYIMDETTRTHAPEIAAAMSKLLKSQNVNFEMLCQGTDGWGLYDLGLWALAEEKAKEFASFIKESGAKTVVANDPSVVYSLKEWYPTLGIELDAEILHHTEYFDRLGISGKFEGVVTYHDPSYLGRYLGIFDAPRSILSRIEGLELAECYFTKEKANPTGPLYGYFNEEWAEMVAARRAQELALAAPVVITASPTTKRNLNAVKEAAGIEVYDIAEILAKS
jgi:Fe-S oxidoreductase